MLLLSVATLPLEEDEDELLLLEVLPRVVRVVAAADGTALTRVLRVVAVALAAASAASALSLARCSLLVSIVASVDQTLYTLGIEYKNVRTTAMDYPLV